MSYSRIDVFSGVNCASGKRRVPADSVFLVKTQVPRRYSGLGDLPHARCGTRAMPGLKDGRYREGATVCLEYRESFTC